MTVLRLGPLEELGADPGITDVAITCEGRVWVDRGNGMSEYHPRIPLRSPATVREYAVQLCSQLGRRLDDARPIADASDDYGVRVHAAIAPLVPQGASISIRLPRTIQPPRSTRCFAKACFPPHGCRYCAIWCGRRQPYSSPAAPVPAKPR